MKVIVPESTFLIWIDCREFGMTRQELSDFFLHKAKVAVNIGGMFGIEGEGFIRMNIGCPKSTVEKALNQIQTAYLSTKF
jgi:cystathionine beta-lyase